MVYHLFYFKEYDLTPVVPERGEKTLQGLVRK